MRFLLDIAPLREHPAFRRLWLGTTASSLGGQLGTFAVTFHIWDQTHSAAAVGLIGLAVAVPLVVLALLGGAFADRLDRRRLVLWVITGQLVTSLLMAGAAFWPSAGVWPMYVLVSVASGLSGLGAPAKRAFIPSLLPANRLAAGLALNHLSFQMAMLGGPVLAGVITARWGTPVCFLIDAATFVAALLGVVGLPTSRMYGQAGAKAIWEGIRFAAQTPRIRGAFLTDLAATVLAMPVALFPVLNAERFGGSPQTLGFFLTAVAVGGVIASALSGTATRRARPGVVLLACAATWGVALTGAGLSHHLMLTLACLAVAGGADTWSVVARGTVVQSATPDSRRGRVAALEHIVGVAGPELGNLRAGLVAAATSGGTAMVIGGLGCVAAIGVLAARTPQLRTPAPQPAAA